MIRTALFAFAAIASVTSATAQPAGPVRGLHMAPAGEWAVLRMGQDKVRDHLNAGAEYIVSGDMSCLMHQQGCAERMKADARFIHIAQVLNGARA